MFKKYLVIFALSLIPSLLVFSGKNDKIFEWCAAHKIFVNIDGLDDKEKSKKKVDFQFWTFSIGIFGSGLIIPGKLAHISHKFEVKNNAIRELIKYNRDMLLEILKTDIERHNHPFKLYIFLPKKGVFPRLDTKLFGQTVLHLNYVEGVSDNYHSDGFTIIVTKKDTQGVTGAAFKEQRVVIADGQEELGKYPLTPSQLTKVKNVEFCAAMPIFIKEKIAGIITIDSEKSVDLDNSERIKFEKSFVKLAAFISKHKLLN